MTYMLDTNICIYAIKNKPEQVFQRVREHLQIVKERIEGGANEKAALIFR